MISKKDAVEMERAAYISGAVAGRMQVADKYNIRNYGVGEFQRLTDEQAKREFPMPMIERPRTIRIESGVMGFTTVVQFSKELGAFVVTENQRGEKMQKPFYSVYTVLLYCAINPEQAPEYEAALQDLRKNPTKLVEDDNDEEG